MLSISISRCNAIFFIERNERSDFGCLLKLWGTRLCLASFVSQSGFRKLAANQSQVEGNRGKLSGTYFFLSFL